MDAQIYGFIQSSFPAGILLGTLTVGFLTSKMKKNKLMAVGIGGEGFLTALISLFAIPLVYQGLTATTVALLMALPIFFMGALNVQVNVPFMTMMQETVPENYRGRVFGLFGSMVTMFTPVSMALAGVLVDVVPTFYFLAIAGGLTLSLGFAIGASKNISGMFDEQAPDTHSFSPAKETLS